MIIRCSGMSPDGGLGCTRAAGHDERGQLCRNLSVGIEWCSFCDSYECEHFTAEMRSANDAERAKREAYFLLEYGDLR